MIFFPIKEFVGTPDMIDLKYDEIDCCSKCNAYIYQDDKFWSKLWA